jgi:hypothetical protein
LFAGAAVVGYKMFGDATESQFTLNLPENLVVSKVAVWTTVILAAISQLLMLHLHFCVGQDQIMSMKSNQLYFILSCR